MTKLFFRSVTISVALLIPVASAFALGPAAPAPVPPPAVALLGPAAPAPVPPPAVA